MRRSAARAPSWLAVTTLTLVIAAAACGDDAAAPGSGTAGQPSDAGKSNTSNAGMSPGGTSNTAGDRAQGGESSDSGAGGSGGTDTTPGDTHDVVIYGCTSAGVIP